MQEYQLIRTCLLQALELRAHMQGSTFCASYEHLTPFFLSFYFPELCCRFLITMPSSFILLTFVSVSLSVLWGFTWLLWNFMDPMSITRDDPEFEGIRERAMQRIVSGEVDKATGRLIDWSKALALEMELSKKPQVIWCMYSWGCWWSTCRLVNLFFGMHL